MLALALPLAARAEYPEKPVSFIVPWPPGDLEDVLTRMIAEDFQNEYGVSAAVVNKPGGGGGPFPGAIEVADRAEAMWLIRNLGLVRQALTGEPAAGPAPVSNDRDRTRNLQLLRLFTLGTVADGVLSPRSEAAAWARTWSRSLWVSPM